MINLRNALNWTKWTNESWIDKAKASKRRLAGLTIPVIDVDYAKDVAPATQMNTLDVFINGTSTENLIAPLKKAGFTVVYMDQLSIKVDNFLTTLPYANTTQEPARSHHDAFNVGQRNLFIVDVADQDNHLFYVCEYEDRQDPLADYTANYQKTQLLM